MTTTTISRSAKSLTLRLNQIEIPSTARPYDATPVVELSRSIAAIGLQCAPTVIEREGRFILVAGRHRIEALKLLHIESVLVRCVDFDDLEARMWTISENLFRTELTVVQRAQQIAEWVQLSEAREKEVSRQVAAKPTGGRPEGGVRAAARELGIEEREARRAVKIAALSDEVKQAAVDHGLDDNQSALLEAAKQPSAEAQVAALRQRAETKTGTPCHDVANPPDLPPSREPVRPPRNLVGISGGELARWIKITTPNDRPHVIRVLEMAAGILRDELENSAGNGSLALVDGNAQ